jgi:TolB-like protein/Tfp pilus assembly protein PilF
MSAAAVRFLKELRRRRVFRTAGLYVVAAWLVLQAANILFPGWGVPGEAIRFLFWAALVGFPVALVFGWIFEITPEGIRRTQPVSSEAELREAMPLGRKDYLLLLAFVIVIGLIVYDTSGRVLRTAAVVEDEIRPWVAEIVENSVAVLPFANLSPDPEQDNFADGISEEILNRLSAFRELKVIARTSSFAFKDSGYEMKRISGLLGVEYLLQGSIRRDSGHIRIAAQLVDHSGVQIWTETFDRELGAVFALQDEIAEAVAISIASWIVPPSAKAREPDLEAYQQYLIGRDLLAWRSPGWLNRSVERFTRAIELDPEYAEPYAERAIALFFAAGSTDEKGELERAREDIDTALALKPDLAIAYAARGLLTMFSGQRDAVEGEALLRRALALDPNLVIALNLLSIALIEQGRHDESQEPLRLAARIDPLSPMVTYNLVLEEARRGRFAEAEPRLLRLLEIPQPSLITSVRLGELYTQAGRLVEATGMAKRGILMVAAAAGPEAQWVYEALISSYARLGNFQRARYWQDRYERAEPGNYVRRVMRYVLFAGHLDWDEMLSGVLGVLDGAGMDQADVPPMGILSIGTLQALTGEYGDAMITLEPLIDPGVARQGLQGPEIDARHGLAWAWLQIGATERAMALLGLLDRYYQDLRNAGRLHMSGELFAYARNTVLLGDTDRALDLLEQAVESGWRGYYAIQRDPRWDSVREDPRFVETMARVKADIVVQRARMEGIDAEDDFAARLDALLAARKAQGARP